MNHLGSIIVASGAVVLSLLAGCTSDGQTPACTPPDYEDCLEPPSGGYLLDAAAEQAATPGPDAAAD
jgi:hypothetical protein